MDGRCTFWPDGWPTWLGGTGDEWLHCCQRHDVFYEVARNFGDYLGAHWQLAQCVAEVSWAMAGVMLAGVVAGTFAFGKKALPPWWLNRQ